MELHSDSDSDSDQTQQTQTQIPLETNNVHLQKCPFPLTRVLCRRDPSRQVLFRVMMTEIWHRWFSMDYIPTNMRIHWKDVVYGYFFFSVFFSAIKGSGFPGAHASCQPQSPKIEHQHASSYLFVPPSPFPIPPWLLLRTSQSSFRGGISSQDSRGTPRECAYSHRHQRPTMALFGWDSQSKYERNQRWKKPRRPVAARLTSWIVERILHKVTDQLENLRVRVDAESSLALLRGEIQVCAHVPEVCVVYLGGACMAQDGYIV
jgi:hypothetical protein